MTNKTDKTITSIRTKAKYHPNGESASKTSYANDKRHGIQTEWDVAGRKRRLREWREGTRHGMEIVWGGVMGGIMSKRYEAFWNNGNWHGLQTEWYGNGQKKHEQMWSADQIHGIDTKRYKGGGKRWEKYFIKRNEGEIYNLSHPELARLEWDEEGNVTVATFQSLIPNS